MIQNEIPAQLKPRKKISHKGDFGRVYILAGSKKFSGAAYLAGLACLKAGAGLVTLGVPETIYGVVARRQPELMVNPLPATSQGGSSQKAFKEIFSVLKNQDVLAVGPGLSQEKETQKLIRKVISHSNSLPVVIDADGLNALSNHLDILKTCRNRAILTPHPGEFLRLFGGKLTEKDSLRKKRALEAAVKFQVIVILKGHYTVVAHPCGKIYVNKTGNPGMAKGGTGDVLTGIIAALLGQKLSLWDSARFGVYLHGLAGDLAVKKTGEISLLAGDLIDFLPLAFRKALSK